MPNPENFVVVLLREMRAEMNARFDAFEKRVDERFAAVDRRFETIERRLEMMHRNGEKALRGFIGHRAMVERTMPSFEDEISSLERRVERLEAAQV
jgi:hypothetical protein